MDSPVAKMVLYFRYVTLVYVAANTDIVAIPQIFVEAGVILILAYVEFPQSHQRHPQLYLQMVCQNQLLYPLRNGKGRNRVKLN